MTAYEIVTSIFWGAQLFLIWRGLVQMGKASKERTPILKTLEAHTEALKEVINELKVSRERTAT